MINPVSGPGGADSGEERAHPHSGLRRGLGEPVRGVARGGEGCLRAVPVPAGEAAEARAAVALARKIFNLRILK